MGKGYWEWAIKRYPKWVEVRGLQPPLRVSLYPGQDINCFDCRSMSELRAGKTSTINANTLYNPETVLVLRAHE